MWPTFGGTQFLRYMNIYADKRAEIRDVSTEKLEFVLERFDPSQEPWYIRLPYKGGLLPDPAEIKAIKDELAERVERECQA